MHPENPQQNQTRPDIVHFKPGDGSGVTLECTYEHNNSKLVNFDIQAGKLFGAKHLRVAVWPEDKELIERTARACAYGGISKLPKIIIADTDVPNAARVIGGSFMFTTGILKSMNDKELDAVVGHELSHHRHFLRDTATRLLTLFGVQAAMFTALLTLSHKYGERVPLLKKISMNPWASGIASYYAVSVPLSLGTRRMEYESDREGAEYAGTDPMISALKTLESETDKVKQKLNDKPLSQRIVPMVDKVLYKILLPIPDHPSTPARINALEKHRPYAEKIIAERNAAQQQVSELK